MRPLTKLGKLFQNNAIFHQYTPGPLQFSFKSILMTTDVIMGFTYTDY